MHCAAASGHITTRKGIRRWVHGPSSSSTHTGTDMPPHDADLIIVGAGLAGLVAAAEAADAGRTVLLLEQEGEQSLGGQAFWSLGGLFLVDSPEQRRLGI